MVSAKALILLVAFIAQQSCTTGKSYSHQERDAAFVGYSERLAGYVSHLSLQWIFPTSTLHHPSCISAKTIKRIVLNTDLGRIKITPRVDLAPKYVAHLVNKARQEGGCGKNCMIYRHEPVPENWGVNRFYGPPYALLQGVLGDPPKVPMDFEGSPVVRQGDVCQIGNTENFYIALADHNEWMGAFTVWGHIEDEEVDPESWLTISNIPTEPYTSTTVGNITSRFLEKEVMPQIILTVE